MSGPKTPTKSNILKETSWSVNSAQGTEDGYLLSTLEYLIMITWPFNQMPNPNIYSKNNLNPTLTWTLKPSLNPETPFGVVATGQDAHAGRANLKKLCNSGGFSSIPLLLLIIRESLAAFSFPISELCTGNAMKQAPRPDPCCDMEQPAENISCWFWCSVQLFTATRSIERCVSENVNGWNWNDLHMHAFTYCM